MSVYKKIIITEEILSIYKPTRLCIKKLAGIYYFCKSTRHDIFKYTGSGIKWKNLIKKYGRKNIETLWVSDWYYSAQEIHDVAIHFSEENDIVNSDKWANQVPEWGLDFHTRKGMKDSEETKLRKSIAKKKQRPLIGAENPNFGKFHTRETVEKQSIGLKKYASNRPDSHNKNLAKALKGNKKLIEANTGDKNGCFKGYYISPTGERFDSSRKAAVVAGVLDKKTLISWAKNNKNGWSYEPKELNLNFYFEILDLIQQGYLNSEILKRHEISRSTLGKLRNKTHYSCKLYEELNDE